MRPQLTPAPSLQPVRAQRGPHPLLPSSDMSLVSLTPSQLMSTTGSPTRLPWTISWTSMGPGGLQLMPELTLQTDDGLVPAATALLTPAPAHAATSTLVAPSSGPSTASAPMQIQWTANNIVTANTPAATPSTANILLTSHPQESAGGPQFLSPLTLLTSAPCIRLRPDPPKLKTAPPSSAGSSSGPGSLPSSPYSGPSSVPPKAPRLTPAPAVASLMASQEPAQTVTAPVPATTTAVPTTSSLSDDELWSEIFSEPAASPIDLRIPQALPRPLGDTALGRLQQQPMAGADSDILEILESVQAAAAAANSTLQETGPGAKAQSTMSGSSVDSSPQNSNLSDQELVSMSIKDLNTSVRHLNKKDVVRLKQRRRTLKNRRYAQECRLRRQMSQQSMEEESKDLQKRIGSLENDLRRARKERDSYKLKLEIMLGLTAAAQVSEQQQEQQQQQQQLHQQQQQHIPRQQQQHQQRQQRQQQNQQKQKQRQQQKQHLPVLASAPKTEAPVILTTQTPGGFQQLVTIKSEPSQSVQRGALAAKTSAEMPLISVITNTIAQPPLGAPGTTVTAGAEMAAAAIAAGIPQEFFLF